MRMCREIILPSLAVLLTISLPLPASAKNVTINNVTVDVPSDFKASHYERGMEIKSDDDEVFLWFETCESSETQALLNEHNKFWKDNEIVLNDPVEENAIQSSGTKQKSMDFRNATWKGDPTVVRYVIIGPLGSANSLVVHTLWASPDGFKTHGTEITGMLQSMSADYRK